MPSRSVVRIDPTASGSGLVAGTPSTGNECCSPSTSHFSTAAAAGTGVGQDDGAAASTAQTSSDSKKSASTEAVCASETTKDTTEDKSHPKGEMTSCPNDVEAEVVSMSTTTQSPISNTLRREDFKSALEYLEAKYVKSIVSEDDATGSNNEQAAVKIMENVVKVSDSNVEKRANGQNTESDIKAKDLYEDSKGGSDDGSVEKRVGNSAESLAKVPNDKTATICNTLDLAIAVADAASNEADLSSAQESSPSEPKNVAGSVFPAFEHLPHLPKPPQGKGQSQNPSNRPIRHQYAYGYEHWPKRSFPPHPFGMMYPPYPYHPPQYFGMPPLVPQAPLPSPPKQGKNNTTQPPDTEKNALKKKATHWYDAVDSVAKSSKSEANSAVIPSFPAFPYPSYLRMPPIVPQAPLPSPPKQGKNDTTQPDAEKNKVKTKATSKVADDAVDDNVAKSSSSEANSPVIPALPALPPIDMKALQQDSLVEEAKKLVQQEILAEEAGKKKKEVRVPSLAVLPPPSAFPPLPSVQYYMPQLPALPSASASASSVYQSSLSSIKKLKANYDSAKLPAVTAKNAQVEAIPLPKLPPLPPVKDTTHLPVQPSASAVDKSFSSSHSDSAPVSSRIEAILRKAGKADEKKAQVEALPPPAVQVPALPSVSAVAVDESSPSPSKKRRLDASQIIRML